MRINVHSNGGYAAGGFDSNGDLPQLVWPV